MALRNLASVWLSFLALGGLGSLNNGITTQTKHLYKRVYYVSLTHLAHTHYLTARL